MDYLKETVGAAVTALGAFLAYRQWRGTRRGGTYLSDRTQAYKQVWDALEEANLYVRRGRYTKGEFIERMREVNTLVLKHGLYIADHDRPKVERYLRAMDQAGVVLTSPTAEQKYEDLKAGMYATMDGPVSLDVLVPEARAAFVELDESRRAVVRSFREAVGANYS